MDKLTNHSAFMTTTDKLLEAARLLLPADPADCFVKPDVINELTEKQQPLVPLLIILIEAALTTSQAIADNAWDDNIPMPIDLMNELANQSYKLAAIIGSSTQCNTNGCLLN